MEYILVCYPAPGVSPSLWVIIEPEIFWSNYDSVEDWYDDEKEWSDYTEEVFFSGEDSHHFIYESPTINFFTAPR